MAMTPPQMIKFYTERVKGNERGFRIGLDQANYFHAVGCLYEIFKCRFMQGLITWRIASGSPVEAMRSAIAELRSGAALVGKMEDTRLDRDLPLESAAIVAFLVDEPWPKVDTKELVSDRLLTAVVGNGLRGNWDEAAWNTGLEVLRKNRRAALCVETNTVYEQLLNGEYTETISLIEHASQLFKKRARDSFYSGGPGMEGGGPDNNVTVDYRLAAIMKKIDYTGENVHRWRW